jgi:protein-disulfide isomerase
MDLVKKSNASFTFLHYPVKENTDYMTKLGYCAYKQDQSKYWKMNDLFFTGDKMELDDPEYVQKTLSGLGLDTAKINACINNPLTEDIVKKSLDEVVKTKFYGTPTVFINDKVLVGPKPYRVYAILLDGLFYWLK